MDLCLYRTILLDSRYFLVEETHNGSGGGGSSSSNKNNNLTNIRRIAEKIKERWQGKRMHEQFPRNLDKKQVDKEQ
jgi:hypothetical protein